MTRDHWVQRGRLAWEQGCIELPRGGWQLVAFMEGFDAAYEKERPNLDLDHQALVAERRAGFKLVVNRRKTRKIK
jgi:hypothetical protein